MIYYQAECPSDIACLVDSPNKSYSCLLCECLSSEWELRHAIKEHY